MIALLKEYKRKFNQYIVIKKAYKNDFKQYFKWQYNNPDVKTKNAFEAKILRQAHILEKGMSLSHPREKFGVQKAEELIALIDNFISLGFKIKKSAPVTNALGVLCSYLEFHKARGFEPESVIRGFEKYKSCLADVNENGIVKMTKEILMDETKKEFPEFFKSRHSIRQFSDRKVDVEDIKKAVGLAMKAPSACNRQSVKTYFYTDENVNAKLGKLIAGNTGFEGEVSNYLIVTSDMSAFYDSFERNQTYVDGGIFAMALVQALHYYGIASCILQNGETKAKDTMFRNVCGNIPENEKIVLFIAIGYYKDEFSYAISHRKSLDDVLKIK